MPASGAAACPCCEERQLRHGGLRFLLKKPKSEGSDDHDDDLNIDIVCDECLLPSNYNYTRTEYPPFVWPRDGEEIKKAVDLVIKETEEVLDRVAGLGLESESVLTYESVLEPLMHLPVYKTNPLVCQAKHMQHCSTDPKIREAASEATTRLAQCKKQGRGRKDVYQVVKKFQEMVESQSGTDSGSETKSSLKLTDYQKHFLSSILLGFERLGLGLNDEDKKQLNKLLDEDAEVCNQYKKNLAEDKTTLEFKVSELEGCPEEWIKERIKKDTHDTVSLTLKYPDLIPVLQNCKISSTRKKLSIISQTSYKNNLDLVAKGINLRKQAAKLLGYPSWSHYVTETRMTGNPEVVNKFLQGIKEKAETGGKEDKERLRQLKQKWMKERGELKEGEEEVTLDSWDTSFFHSLLLKEEYGVDHEKIRKYFPCSHVVQGTLSIYQDLLGLVFTELFNFDTWHPEVRLFKVDDKATNERIGHFYLDLHPREGKYNHAAIFHLLKRKWLKDEGRWQVPVDCMLTNLPSPTVGENGEVKEALLRHDDVVTFFHEFGHIMHGLCAEGPGNSTTLAKCPRDFVEAPSQMLENWCYEKEVLEKYLSKHVDTGESLPGELIGNLKRAKNCNEGFFMLRQVYLASLDMIIHGVGIDQFGGEIPQTAGELQQLVDRLRPEISLVENPDGCNMLRNFGHLMNQYSSAYYGYLWSEVLSADMFESKFKVNPFDIFVGMEYRKKVLGVGGVGKIGEHLKGFLGREPREEPFLRRRGILK